MVNKVLLANGIAAFLFLAGGVVELAFCLVVRSQRDDVATEGKEAVRNLLYQDFPLTAGIVNAAFTLVAFLVMTLALLTNSKGWLRFGGYAVAFCGLFTMCVGVFLWVMTLTIGEEFFDTYLGLEPETQSLIQASFECCGYKSSSEPPFIIDEVCPSPAAAALLRGCKPFIASFSNLLLDNIFTAVFGVVGIDALFVLAIACLHKERVEIERYRHIDEKTGYL
ncbi:hypothetical protein N3K66_000631 [Trichothecium roseum]|uniref:Uncharacterized protein n=1 Tax=Trichothecium roseum TaxID=47278 RepID=A0ACC0VDY7_9HYPO|nr:hypothetical protein N3K66_000631 [Trichothecium roseum]